MNPTLSSRLRRALALLLFVVPAGCATKGDLRTVTNELRLVRASQDSLLSALQRQARMTQDSLRGTSAQIVDVRGTVNQQLGRMQDELAMVRQENAQLTRALSQIRDQMERLLQAQSNAVPTGYPMPGSQPGSGGAEELYYAAQGALARGSLGTARSSFEDVIQLFPTDPLAASAQYALADILVRENKKDEAIAAFEKVANDYSTSPSAPDALYQVGDILVDLRRFTEARAAFQRIIGSYGDSPAARRATEKLRELPPGQ